MELFVFLMIVVCIGCLLFSGKKREGNNHEVPLKGDDFDGRSVGSIFLLEEIVDTARGTQGAANQVIIQGDETEEEFFEEDFFE